MGIYLFWSSSCRRFPFELGNGGPARYLSPSREGERERERMAPTRKKTENRKENETAYSYKREKRCTAGEGGKRSMRDGARVASPFIFFFFYRTTVGRRL